MKMLKKKDPVIIYDRDATQKKAIKVLAKKKYKFVEEVGRGSFGDVLAIKSKKNKEMLAAKIIHPDFTSSTEVSLWPQLDLVNIVPVLDIIRREKG